MNNVVNRVILIGNLGGYPELRELENKQWEKDGEKHYSTEIRLKEFMLLGDRK